MTLNITALTSDIIYQSADFRLWDPARNRLITDSSSKLVSLSEDEGEGSITYTGIGNWRKKDTADWIVSWLTQVASASFSEIAEVLRVEGSAWLTSVSEATKGKIWPHSFVVAAFVNNSPTAYLISNYQGFQEEPFSRPLTNQLSVSTIRYVDKPIVFVSGCLKSSVSRSQRRRLEQLIARAPHDSARVRHVMALANKQAAREARECPISEDCAVHSLSREGTIQGSALPRGARSHVLFGDTNIGDSLRELARGLVQDDANIVASVFASSGRDTIDWTPCSPQLAQRSVPSDFSVREIDTRATRNSIVTGVNASGEAVGASENLNGVQAPCRWGNRGPEFLENSGGITGAAWGINGAGDVVGSLVGAARSSAYLWRTDGSSMLLEVEGSSGSAAARINESGQAGGWASFGPTEAGQLGFRPARWLAGAQAETLTEIDATWGEVIAMNRAGSALILAYDENRAFPILWTGDDVRALAEPGQFFYPAALDDFGHVYAWVWDDKRRRVSVKWTESEGWRQLGLPPDWLISDASSTGVIAGTVGRDGWNLPWIREGYAQPEILPHYTFHHALVTRVLDRNVVVGGLHCDHQIHPVIWTRGSST